MQHIIARIKCKKSYIYKFNDAETLFEIVLTLYDNYSEKSSLYIYKKQYYLEMCRSYNRLEKYRAISKTNLKDILEEYGKIVSNNAILEIGKAIKGP